MFFNNLLSKEGKMILAVLKLYLVIIKVVGVKGAVLSRFPKEFYAEDDEDAECKTAEIKEKIKQKEIFQNSKVNIEIDKLFQVREIEI